MIGQKRLMAVVVAVVALALTVFGIVFAATDPNPAALGRDPLALNGYPPHSADVAVSLTTSGGLGLNANITANFTDNRASALVSFPTIETPSSVDVLMASDHLYARSADVSSGPWFDTAFKTLNFFGVSLELTKPDIYLIAGLHKSVTHSGYSTTYNFTQQHVVLSTLLGSAKSLSTLGSVRWSITVGSQGEASASTLVVTSKHATTTISAKVLSYNEPAKISVPASKDVQALSLSGLEKLLKGRDFASLLIPRDLTSLSKTSIS
ncbi:MAG TPA: hypothetical protein VG246_12635 [Acidimicrobiales bacterium]|nr:hypothetical protein [Acidimicrobiales bacterium]